MNRQGEVEKSKQVIVKIKLSKLLSKRIIKL